MKRLRPGGPGGVFPQKAARTPQRTGRNAYEGRRTAPSGSCGRADTLVRIGPVGEARRAVRLFVQGTGLPG